MAKAINQGVISNKWVVVSTGFRSDYWPKGHVYSSSAAYRGEAGLHLPTPALFLLSLEKRHTYDN